MTREGLRDSWIKPAMRLSCEVTPLVTSITRTQRSARRIVRSARITLKTSTEVECLLRARMPAVSMRRYFSPSRS